MFVFELIGTENHPVYQRLTVENLGRQYDFFNSIVRASLELGQPMLSNEVIKAFNYHALACLHAGAGEFRTCHVEVGEHKNPPMPHVVPAMMQMFTNLVNRVWTEWDPVALATFVLWRINNIHPFVNGNGRTARLSAYFVLCLKSGGLLPGDKLLPERLREVRDEHIVALQHAHQSSAAGTVDLAPLHAIVSRLVDEQLREAQVRRPA